MTRYSQLTPEFRTIPVYVKLVVAQERVVQVLAALNQV